MNEWYSASLLAGLPGMSQNKRVIIKKATKEGWESRPRKAQGGGKEYFLGSLPIQTQAALVGMHGSEQSSQTSDAASDKKSAASLTPFNYDSDTLWSRYDKKPASQKDEANRRFTLLQSVLTLTKNKVSLVAAMKAVGEQNNVSWRTIQGWYHGKNGKPGIKHYNASDWLPALCPEHVGRTSKASCDERAWEFIKADYLRPEKPTASACFWRLKRAAEEHVWAIPAQRTLERRLNDIPRTIRVLKREGESALVALYPAQERTVKDIHALQWINGDGYQHNVFVKWPGEDKPVRPKTWFWQDIHSRKILAYRVDLSENTDSIRLSFGDLVDNYGIPEHVVIDNTRAAANKWMTGGVKNRYRFKVKEDDPLGLFPTLGITIHWTSVIAGKGHGQAKPIERSFGVGGIGEYVDKHPKFAGAYTGENPMVKPENYGKTAVPVETFLTTLQEEITAWNSRQKRRTEMCAGIKSYDQAFNDSYETSIVQKANPEQRRLWMLTAEAIRVKKDGSFTLDAGSAKGISKNRYSALELLEYVGHKIVVRFDPQDLHGIVYAYTLDNRFIGHAACISTTGFGDTEAARSFNRQRERFVKASKLAAKAETQMNIIDVADRLPVIEQTKTPAATVVRPLRPDLKLGRPVPEPQLSNQDEADILDFQKSFETKEVDVREDGPHERYERWALLNNQRSASEQLNEKDEKFWRVYPKGDEYRSMRDFYADFEGVMDLDA
ncbi:MAG: transposase domain-containing protein [Cycloclasticus sp.]